ncbi:MAG: ABC transporter ATP-binding protein [Acidobacteria bacterium]|nr:ABC transporter ATP-binding protein [Acidobacteriota bacterium]
MIKVENLGKQYVIGHQRGERYTTLRDVVASNAKRLGRKLLHPLTSASSNPHVGREDFWALTDVSFEVRPGEAIGIIGRNGAGKSTLLKILSRITEPTTGSVRIRGRLASLLEVGTGFHPELTGRENIFLNGAVLGMTKAEIRQKFDEIVAFAEVGKFLDTPVKRYSSGMYIRLAFAVAAHLEPEILVVDEVLAVGDAEFQKKCLGKMEEVATKENRTILFVSHNMAAIENLCQRVILLEQGSVTYSGETTKAINLYLSNILPSAIEAVPLMHRTDRSGDGSIRLTSFHVEDQDGQRIAAVSSGMDVTFVLGYKCYGDHPYRKVDVGFSAHSTSNQTLFVFYSSYMGRLFELTSREGEFRCRVSKFPLAPGRYGIGARVVVGGDEADWPNDGIGYLEVEAGDFYGTGAKGYNGAAPFLVLGNWSLSDTASL